MKNQLILDMEKVTVFKGCINGQEFDNVNDYNARMKELLDAGAENISASSSTSVKTVKEPQDCKCGDEAPCPCEVCTCSNRPNGVYDEDASFYPYMDANDPYYLDLLVTEDPAVNAEALNTMEEVFTESYRYICDTLADPKVSQQTRREYLTDVQTILSGLKDDHKHTKKALDSIVRKEAELRAELKALEGAENVLRDALPVIEKLDEFYRAVECKTLEEITNTDRAAEKTECQCEQNCQCEQKVPTKCVETEKTKVYDLNTIINTIFGESLFGGGSMFGGNNIRRGLR